MAPAFAAGRGATVPPSIASGGRSASVIADDVVQIGDVEVVHPGAARSRRKWLSRAGVPSIVLLLSIGVYFAVLQLPRVAYGSVGLFPARLQEPVRQVIDLAVMQTAAVRDGLKWIDVGDPRVRKGNRLKPE